MKVLYLGNAIDTNSSSGGYIHVKDYLDIIEINKKFWEMGTFFRMINDIIAVRRACKLSKDYDIIHSVHQDSYFFPLLFKCKCKSVGTIHVDITGDYSLFRKLTLRYFLKKLDLIVVLSTEQEKKLKSLGYNCKYIPHGYDRPVFNRVNLKEHVFSFDETKLNIFFSGTMYRNINELEDTVNYCAKNNDIVFHVLSQKGYSRERFKKYENVVLYDRLDDDVFFTLMEKCDYVFLPLTFATANNSVLESHCLGKICILPKEGGIVDYSSPRDLLYSSKSELFTIFDNLKKRESNIYEDVIEFSNKFSWNSVYKQLEKAYQELLN